MDLWIAQVWPIVGDWVGTEGDQVSGQQFAQPLPAGDMNSRSREFLFMSGKQLLGVVLAILMLSTVRESHAQTLPTPDDFDRALKACAANQKTGLAPNTIDSISKLYAGENSRQILKDPNEFVRLFSDNNTRIDAYNLYANCISTIVPRQLSQRQINLHQINRHRR